jgi:hypothetical protein
VKDCALNPIPSRRVLPWLSYSRWFGAAIVIATLLWPGDEPKLLAATDSNKTYGLFSGRARITLPNSAKTPKRFGKRSFIVQPKDPSKKFVMFVVRVPLRRDELKMSRTELANSLRNIVTNGRRTLLSFSASRQDFRADFTTFVELPWQAVGTTPARVIAKVTRTADKQFIGSLLLCDPTQWSDPAIGAFKRAVTKTKVSQR